MKKNEAIEVKNPNEFKFSKTKGFGAYNYGIISTQAVVEDQHLTVEKTSKWLFFKGKPKTAIIDYQSIENIAVKVHFSLGDLISGIIIAIISIAFSQLWGLLFVALLIFCSYGKNIIITQKSSTSKVIIMCEGFSQQEAIDTFIKRVNEKTVNAA
jgi:hypothetical protein